MVRSMLRRRIAQRPDQAASDLLERLERIPATRRIEVADVYESRELKACAMQVAVALIRTGYVDADREADEYAVREIFEDMIDEALKLHAQTQARTTDAGIALCDGMGD